jgi:hypothetical protein
MTSVARRRRITKRPERNPISHNRPTTGVDVLNSQATPQLSDMAGFAAASRRACQGIRAYAWPAGSTFDANPTFVELEVIPTAKHRHRRPEDPSH